MYLWPREWCARHFQQPVCFWKAQLQLGSVDFHHFSWIEHCSWLDLLPVCSPGVLVLAGWISSLRLAGAGAATSFSHRNCPQITIWLKTCENTASKQRQHFETFNEGMEWEEKRTLIQVERNLEMQEMREKKHKKQPRLYECYQQFEKQAGRRFRLRIYMQNWPFNFT